MLILLAVLAQLGVPATCQRISLQKKKGFLIALFLLTSWVCTWLVFSPAPVLTLLRFDILLLADRRACTHSQALPVQQQKHCHTGTGEATQRLGGLTGVF